MNGRPLLCRATLAALAAVAACGGPEKGRQQTPEEVAEEMSA
jgi:hypothetical protein